MRVGFPAISAMQSKPDSIPQTQFLMPDLMTMLNARQPLYRLVQTIDWPQIATAFGPLDADEGRPALPIRRMVALLLSKSPLFHYWPFWPLSPIRSSRVGAARSTSTLVSAFWFYSASTHIRTQLQRFRPSLPWAPGTPSCPPITPWRDRSPKLL
jgi:hypothetical protein